MSVSYGFRKFPLFSVLFIALLMLASCDSIDAYFSGKEKTQNAEEKTIYIPTGTDLDQLTDLLIDKNIIEGKDDFLAVAEYKEFTSQKIGAGKYVIAPNTELKTLINGFTLNRLGNGNQEKEVEITFNNCRHIYDIAGKVSRQIEMDSTSFVNYILSDSILSKYGFSEERIAALFLPNTYRAYWDTDEQEFVQLMAAAFKNFWNPERLQKLKNKGLKGQSDAVTLASVVYKEQDKYPEEWPIIAGLYLNRLEKNMLLQSDPTFRYCWGDKLDGVQRLTYAHRDIDCPYNTYKYAGLPPGPICVPPSQVVDAVLNADENDYLFMCAKPQGDGLHNFAVTLSQHNKNAQAFQQWMNQRE
ncbi:MAG: endolytic transglycosylase MltG [Brumimicrobium sp.]|nr:endolytic transglycosylase MltG [Brumimicrobium sp.]